MIIQNEFDLIAALEEKCAAQADLIKHLQSSLKDLDKEKWEVECQLLAIKCPNINVNKLRELTGL